MLYSFVMLILLIVSSFIGNELFGNIGAISFAFTVFLVYFVVIMEDFIKLKENHKKLQEKYDDLDEKVEDNKDQLRNAINNIAEALELQIDLLAEQSNLKIEDDGNCYLRPRLVRFDPSIRKMNKSEIAEKYHKQKLKDIEDGNFEDETECENTETTFSYDEQNEGSSEDNREKKFQLDIVGEFSEDSMKNIVRGLHKIFHKDFQNYCADLTSETPEDFLSDENDKMNKNEPGVNLDKNEYYDCEDENIM